MVFFTSISSGIDFTRGGKMWTLRATYSEPCTVNDFNSYRVTCFGQKKLGARQRHPHAPQEDKRHSCCRLICSTRDEPGM